MRELERLIEAMQRHSQLRKNVNHTNPSSAELSLSPDEVPTKSAKEFKSPKGSAK